MESMTNDAHGVMRTEWGRAFIGADGALYVDDMEGSLESYEDAFEFTSAKWSGHPYDFVVSRQVSDWEIYWKEQ